MMERRLIQRLSLYEKYKYTGVIENQWTSGFVVVYLLVTELLFS